MTLIELKIEQVFLYFYLLGERVAEWLRRLTRKPKIRTAVGSNPARDSLVAVRNSSPGRPEPCEGNLVAAAGSCSGLMVKHPWPLLEISFSDFRRLATLNINTYLPTYLGTPAETKKSDFCEVSKFRDVQWPRIFKGGTVVRQCPNGTAG